MIEALSARLSQNYESFMRTWLNRDFAQYLLNEIKIYEVYEQTTETQCREIDKKARDRQAALKRLEDDRIILGDDIYVLVHGSRDRAISSDLTPSGT